MKYVLRIGLPLAIVAGILLYTCGGPAADRPTTADATADTSTPPASTSGADTLESGPPLPVPLGPPPALLPPVEHPRTDTEAATAPSTRPGATTPSEQTAEPPVAARPSASSFEAPSPAALPPRPPTPEASGTPSLSPPNALHRPSHPLLAIMNDPARVDRLRTPFRIPLPEGTPLDALSRTRGHPTSTISTPTAFGPGWGQVYAGASYQNRIRYDDWRDGILTLGGGLGNPERYVGLEVTVNLLDTYDDFGQDRSLSLKLHRRLPFQSAIAVGYENIWHTSGTDGGSSRYIVGSKIVRLRERPTAPFGSLVVSAGVGDDRFLPEADFARGASGVNAFGSAALRLLRPVNAVANWTGQDLNLGLSIAPIRSWPVVVTPSLVDVTGRAGDGARFSLSVGVGYTLHR